MLNISKPTYRNILMVAKHMVIQIHRYRILIAGTMTILLIILAMTLYSVYMKSITYVKFVTINNQTYYVSDFQDYMSVKTKDLGQSIMDNQDVFQFYLDDFINYKLIYQEALDNTTVVHIAVEEEVRTTLEQNAFMVDVLDILSDQRTYDSFQNLTYADKIIYEYMSQNFYQHINISTEEIQTEYEQMRTEFDSYPAMYVLTVSSHNESMMDEINQELQSYDFEEVVDGFASRYQDIYRQDGIITIDEADEHFQQLKLMDQGETYSVKVNELYYIYQLHSTYTSSRNFIPLELIRNSIGLELYFSKMNSYIDDYMKILYTTSDIQTHMKDGEVLKSFIY